MTDLNYEYVGGGYFREKGHQKGEIAPTLHGEQILELARQLIAEARNSTLSLVYDPSLLEPEDHHESQEN